MARPPICVAVSAAELRRAEALQRRRAEGIQLAGRERGDLRDSEGVRLRRRQIADRGRGQARRLRRRQSGDVQGVERVVDRALSCVLVSPSVWAEVRLESCVVDRSLRIAVVSAPSCGAVSAANCAAPKACSSFPLSALVWVVVSAPICGAVRESRLRRRQAPIVVGVRPCACVVERLAIASAFSEVVDSALSWSSSGHAPGSPSERPTASSRNYRRSPARGRRAAPPSAAPSCVAPNPCNSVELSAVISRRRKSARSADVVKDVRLRRRQIADRGRRQAATCAVERFGDVQRVERRRRQRVQLRRRQPVRLGRGEGGQLRRRRNCRRSPRARPPSCVAVSAPSCAAPKPCSSVELKAAICVAESAPICAVVKQIRLRRASDCRSWSWSGRRPATSRDRDVQARRAKSSKAR